MPKNARSKSAKQNIPQDEDTSFIVFGDAKPNKKKRDKSNNEDGAQDDKKAKGKTSEAQQVAEAKRSDTRTLIAGASWTGKLPVNLLSEHFQKLRWNKPDYKIRKDGDKHFAYAMVLSKTNQKTREMMFLPAFKIPNELEDKAHQSTAVEARNFTAAYMLFRVASAKNLHVMLPPTYKDLWKNEFAEIKRNDELNGKGWMYEADPFTTFLEREKTGVDAAKAREKKQKEEEAQTNHDLPTGAAMLSTRSTRSDKSLMKGWERVPKVDLGRKTRKEIERLVRGEVLWNPHGVTMNTNTKSRLVHDLTVLGFRKSHVEEAADICKDREEMIEWLLIHVPEDDLPTWTLPEGYTAGVSVASTDLKRAGAVKCLAAAGYSMELCEEAYDNQDADESKAAAFLQARLLRLDMEGRSPRDTQSSTFVNSSTEDISEYDVWEEEMSSLESIYDALFSRPSPSICRIDVDIEQDDRHFVVQIRKPFGPYPAVVPIMAFEAAIPAYIRLSILRQALLFAELNCLGAPMIYDLVDWLQQNASKIIQNPGRLVDVSSGLAAADHSFDTKERNRMKGRKPQKPIDWEASTLISERLLADWQIKQESPAQQSMMAVRRALPAWKMKGNIIQTCQKCKVTIISGETGSGKSTQSVQFILDDLIQRQRGDIANIICTQPRRVSALGLADRVAAERCSQVGDEVGYVIRGDSKQKFGKTKITFMTTGILLRQLQNSSRVGEDTMAALANVSHVVVDEVHERSLDTDFLLALLRQILNQRESLRIILMSATLDADIFKAYFSECGPVGHIEIEGRTHPVQDFYLDDIVRLTGFKDNTSDTVEERDPLPAKNPQLIGLNYDLIVETIRHIDQSLGPREGGILIFVPGAPEIERLLYTLNEFPSFHALPLHASLLPVEQKRVFSPPPAGKRKVVIATNVAETSITIEDIVAVIDSGRVKETSYDSINNMVRLAETWASKAACKQRRGRAGRVRAGECFKLYTRNVESKMIDRPEPEIKRVPLEQMCLSIKAMGIQNVQNFLISALTPPESTAVENALKLLSNMGAITHNELTALGQHLAVIPTDLRLGKLLIYGAIFGCLESMLTIAAVLTARSPFIFPRERDQKTRDDFDRIRRIFSNHQGDLLVDLRAYQQWSALRSKGTPARDVRLWCQDHWISSQTMFEIASNRSQYLSVLKEISFIPMAYSSTDLATYGRYNKYNADDALLRALIAGSFNPQIARIQLPDKKFAAGAAGAIELDPEARAIKYFDQTSERLFIHPSSTLFSSQISSYNASFIAYFNKMATSKTFIRDVTPFNAYSLLMFAGQVEVDTLGRGLIVDEWIRLRGWARIGVLVSRLREMLDRVLERMFREPGEGMKAKECDVIDLVRRLIENDGLDA